MPVELAGRHRHLRSAGRTDFGRYCPRWRVQHAGPVDTIQAPFAKGSTGTFDGDIGADTHSGPRISQREHQHAVDTKMLLSGNRRVSFASHPYASGWKSREKVGRCRSIAYRYMQPSD